MKEWDILALNVYAATTASSLKIHIESKHKGVRYPCSQCEYSTTERINLKRYVGVKHEGVIYACSQCKYAAAGELKRHIEYKHKDISAPNVSMSCNYNSKCS